MLSAVGERWAGPDVAGRGRGMAPVKEQWAMPGAQADAASKRPAGTERWAGEGMYWGRNYTDGIIPGKYLWLSY